MQIWTLVRLGFDRASIEEGISLLQRLSWSTNLTEQGHSASSRVLRHHKVSALTMQVRRIVCQARPLFQVSVEEKQLGKLHDKLRNLDRKNSEKIGAKHAFLADLIHTAGGGALAARHADGKRGKQVVACHGVVEILVTCAEGYL